jgi:hypothetical protein
MSCDVRCSKLVKDISFQRSTLLGLSNEISFSLLQLFFTEREVEESKSKLLYDWRSVRQSVCLGVKPTLEFVTRYYFLSECCCLKVSVFFSVGRPLWREDGSEVCSAVTQWSWRLHRQVRRISQARNQFEADNRNTFLAWLTDAKLPRWMRNVPPKRRLSFSGLNGDISQKTSVCFSLFSDDTSETPCICMYL